MPTAAHFIYIPAVLILGIVIGWILGSRAAADAYAAQLRKIKSGTDLKAIRGRASLSPYRQSLRENLGQSRSDDLLLRAGYVVFDAQRRHCAGAGVDDAVRRTRVAIARLTNRTAVREVAHIRLYSRN